MKFVFDVQKAQVLADRIAQLTPEQVQKFVVPTINEVGERTYDRARDKITEGINLSDQYLRQRFTVTKATSAKPEVEIRALGSRDLLTPLSRYDAKIIIGRTRASYVKGSKFRSRGAGLLPLNGGRQEGVNVGVTRGSEKDISYAFMLPLRAGKVAGGNALGVFTRPKDGGPYRHRYGPQVYQLFRVQAEKMEQEVLDDMETSLLSAAARAVEESLK